MNREDSNSRRRENCLFSNHQRIEQFSLRRELLFSDQQRKLQFSSRRELLFSYQQRKVQFSSRRELLFFETERGCFFTSALKQGLVLCTIMTKPKTSKNGIALSVILQLMWNWARRTKVLREAFIIKERINKYFFPSRKSFIKHFVFGFFPNCFPWHLYIYRKSEMSYGPKIHWILFTSSFQKRIM